MITTQYGVVETSHLRELQWSVAWWQRAYAEAGASASLAWSYVDEAIENNESHEHIQALRDVAVMFDSIRQEAWASWQQAKAQYLALHN
jgi:hypothetical protein